MKKFLEKHLLFIVVLSIVVIFLLPDMWYWARVEGFEYPYRYFQPNNAHYLAIWNTAHTTGQIAPNSLLWEQGTLPSHYRILQTVSHIFSWVTLPIVFWWLVLRLYTALGTFFVLYLLFLNSGIQKDKSIIWSGIFVFVYGFVAFQGYAIGNWYFPTTLLGIYLVQRFNDKPQIVGRDVVLMCLASVFFSVHSVLFSMCNLAVALLWCVKLKNNNFKRNEVGKFVIWLVFAVFLLMFFYGSFLAEMGNDTLQRTISMRNSLVAHPVFTLQTICLLGISVITGKYVWVAFSLASLIGLNSNLITGSYMANDHYVVLLEIMFWFLAVVVLFGEKQKRRIGFSVFLFLVALFGFAESVNHTGYSVSALVRWLPVPLSLICIALSMSYPDALRHLRENKTGWIIFLGLSVFCIAFGFTDIRSLEYRHKDVKAYGQVYEYLRSKPRGVVMADHYVASSAAIYTGHAVYWDQMAFTDPVKNEDLFLRYYDNRLFFESDKFFEGIESESVLFGVPDRCGQYVRLKWLTVYPLLNKIMYPYDKFCDEVARMRKLNTAQIDSTYVDFKDGLRRSNKWNPVFKLDWLIKNEKEFDELPQYLRSCFKLDKSFDGTGVYRSVCSSI